MPLPTGAHYVKPGTIVDGVPAARGSKVRLSSGVIVSNRTAQNLGNAERGLPSLERMRTFRVRNRIRPRLTRDKHWQHATLNTIDTDKINAFIALLPRRIAVMFYTCGEYYPNKPSFCVVPDSLKAVFAPGSRTITDADIPTKTDYVSISWRQLQ